MLKGEEKLVDILIHCFEDSTKKTNPKYKKGTVSYKVYRSIIKIWAAFSATDINKDHSLNKKELKMLL
jgi:hypothetical protein